MFSPQELEQQMEAKQVQPRKAVSFTNNMNKTGCVYEWVIDENISFNVCMQTGSNLEAHS